MKRDAEDIRKNKEFLDDSNNSLKCENVIHLGERELNTVITFSPLIDYVALSRTDSLSFDFTSFTKYFWM